MVRVRFSLRFLLILATMAALGLGYGQVRRAELLHVFETLHEHGYVFDVPNSWHDQLWQRKPVVAYRIAKSDDFAFSSEADDCNELYVQMKEQWRRDLQLMEKYGLIKEIKRGE